MKDFKNTTKMVSGHRFASGGHVAPFAREHSLKPTAADEGNSGVKRSKPTNESEKTLGGKTELNSGYANGGKVVHVHQHYHNGKRMPSKRAIEKARRKSEGALISSGTAGVKLGKNASSGSKGTPSIRSKKATGGTINPRATGGTINPMNCGGAMYAEGGGVKAALEKHVESPAPRGHKGLGAMIRRGR